MIDPDTFLTTLYVTVDDLLNQLSLPEPRRRGPALALRQSEVVTLALDGQWAHFGGEAAFYRPVAAHLRAAFPRLPARSQDNRAVRACQHAITAVGQRLARLLDATNCAYEALDSTGVVTRNSKRRGRGWLDGQANKGWCTRLGWYHGLHLLLWAGTYGAEVVCPPKPAYTRSRRWPKALRRAHAARRQIIETVNRYLLEPFGLEHERPHALDGVRARLAAKAALHNFCLWLNVQLGRSPIAVADLIDWP